MLPLSSCLDVPLVWSAPKTYKNNILVNLSGDYPLCCLGPRTKVKAMPREAISEKKFKHIDNPAKHVSIITLLESVAWHVIANNKDNSRLVSENAELFQPSFLNVSHFYTQV